MKTSDKLIAEWAQAAIALEDASRAASAVKVRYLALGEELGSLQRAEANAAMREQDLHTQALSALRDERAREVGT